MTTYLGKSCSFCLPRVPFVNYHQFMYLVISLLVLRAGYGIWLYQFLIIAYLFTLLNAYLFIHDVFILKYTPTRNQPSPKARSDAHPPGSGTNTFPAGFTTQAKENTRFYAAENTLLHNFHQATCPIKHMAWAASWQTNKMACAPNEDWDQPWHPPSLIRVFAVRTKKAWVLSYPLSAQRRLWFAWRTCHFVGSVMRRLVCLW